MSNVVSASDPLTSGEVTLIGNLQALGISGAGYAIAKTGTNTFANVSASGGSSGLTIGTTTITSGTTGRLLYDNAGVLGELDTATYPSITELSYVKGVTSAIQTQINAKGVGTVTSVAAITLGTTGTDLSSTVATGTTTPVITLQVPTASASNRGALSSTDWSTFNNKGSGTVTAVSVATANGVSGSSSGGATPALTIALRAITPTSVNGLSVGIGSGAFISNVAIGNYSSISNTSGNNNTANGYYTLYTNSSGSYNTAFGSFALTANATGSKNVALGYYAGYFETGSNAFYVNNIAQANTANDKSYSLLYGTFSGTAGSL